MASLAEILRVVRRRRLTTRRFPRVDVVIIHSQGAQDFTPLLSNRKVLILDPLPVTKTISLHPVVLIRTLLNRLNGMSRETAYLASLVAQCKPRLVVTRVHNSKPFQRLDRALPKIPFLALQNGTLAIELDFPADQWTIHHSHLACLGQYEVDQYTRHGALVQNFHIVGSLKLNQYLNFVKTTEQMPVYDICLVSDYGPEEHPGQLCEYLSKYSHETGRRICVAGRTLDITNANLENRFFQHHLGELFDYLARTNDEFASYRAIHNSKVVVSWCSSMLREALALRKPILAFNPTGNERYNFPVPGMWAMTNSTYEEFRDRLDWLLNLNGEQFEQTFGDLSRYLMANSSGIQTESVLRSLVDEITSG